AWPRPSDDTGLKRLEGLRRLIEEQGGRVVMFSPDDDAPTAAKDIRQQFDALKVGNGYKLIIAIAFQDPAVVREIGRHAHATGLITPGDLTKIIYNVKLEYEEIDEDDWIRDRAFGVDLTDFKLRCDAGPNDRAQQQQRPPPSSAVVYPATNA